MNDPSKASDPDVSDFDWFLMLIPSWLQALLTVFACALVTVMVCNVCIPRPGL